MTVRLAVIYYSATGNVHTLAEQVAAGGREEGAEVRVRKVPELAPDSAIEANPAWREHHEMTRGLPPASVEDIDWAHAIAFGTPTRFGNVAAQLKQLLDQAGPLWARGALTDKVVSGFVSAANRHGGQESTLLALYNTLYHWGAIIAAPGYIDATSASAGGNPYGTSHVGNDGPPSAETLAAARYQGQRLVQIAGRLQRVDQPGRALAADVSA